MKRSILPALCLLALLLGACSHTQTASDVLPFRDEDVESVYICAQRPAPEGLVEDGNGCFCATISDPAAIESLLDNLRGMKSLGRFDGGRGILFGDQFTFIFYLADGQVFAANLRQEERSRTDEDTAVFQNDLLRLKIEYVSDNFCAFLDDLTQDWRFVPSDELPPLLKYGYSTPGDSPITDVLAFDDADVVGLTIYDCRLGDGEPNFHMEVTDPEVTDEILARLRDAAVREARTLDEIPASSNLGLYFAFHLADGRLYTVAYSEEPLGQNMIILLSDGHNELTITHNPALYALLDSLDYAHIPSDPPRGRAAPPFGYSTPGEA